MSRVDGPVLIAGAGISGRGVARLLERLEVPTVIADDNVAATGAISTAEAMDRVDEFSRVVTSPGWLPQTPLFIAVREAGLEVVGDVQLAWEIDRSERLGPARTWLAVTGTNGKTTTTSMAGDILRASGRRVLTIGNIGASVAEAVLDVDADIFVVELSSFQLHWAPRFVPDVGVLLNLAEDHLDWHGSMQAYADAKYRVLTGPVAIAGTDSPEVCDLLSRRPVPGRLVTFGLAEPGDVDFGVRDGALCGPDGPLAPVAGINPPGPAGVADAVAAAALANTVGVSPAHIAEGLAGFTVALHRGQVVSRTAGLLWIDNSKATNPHAADAALAGLGPVVWIAGGQLKGAEVDDLIARHADHLAGAILLGADRFLIADALGRRAPRVPVEIVDTQDPGVVMGEVVAAALRIAPEGAAVVLAPAAASLDMFSGMAARGDAFAEAVHRLEGRGEGA